MRNMVTLSLIIVGMLALTGCENENKLYKSVKIFADKNCQGGNIVEVTLSELTDFDWDEALVYRLLINVFR